LAVLEPARPGPRSNTELFGVFSALALQGFGGVLPVAQRELVENRRWLSREEFVEMLSVGQVLPGPNVVNVALMVGDRFHGSRGAMAALAGMLVFPLLIVLALAALYAHLAHVPAVAGALRGMGAVSAGLIAAMAFKLAPALLHNPMGRIVCALGVVVTVALVFALRWPMAWVVLGWGGALCVFAWWQLKPAPPP
jgi:chromate transporter